MPPNQPTERVPAALVSTVIDRPSPAVQALQAEAAHASAVTSPSTARDDLRRAAPSPAAAAALSGPTGLPKDLRTTDPGTPGPFAGKPADGASRGPALSVGPVPEPGPVALSAAEAKVLAEASASVSTGNDVVARPAPLWARMMAFTVDAAVIAGFVAALLLVAAQVVGAGDTLGARVESLTKVALPAGVLVALFAFVYATVCAFLFKGRTLGRRLAGLHLVDKTGQHPRAMRALLRAGFSLLSFALFLSGFWWALFDRRSQTLHDKLSGTFVVKLVG